MKRGDKLLFFHGVTRSIRDLFRESHLLFTPLTVFLKFLTKMKRFQKKIFTELELYKGDQNKGCNTI